jgi:hypothetical protein
MHAYNVVFSNAFKCESIESAANTGHERFLVYTKMANAPRCDLKAAFIKLQHQMRSTCEVPE